MGVKPPIKLSRLRDIGWREWDPIGLLATGETSDHKPFADEYDRYLLKLAGNLRRGGALQKAVETLLRIEREDMGLGPYPGQEARAEETAHAIQRYVADLDGEH